LLILDDNGEPGCPVSMGLLLAGQILAIPGTPQKQMCIIVRGYADLYMGELLIDTLAAGDSFGESVGSSDIPWYSSRAP
jgi:CRP-like cAMP-binding protein